MTYFIVNISGDMLVYIDYVKALETAQKAGVPVEKVRGFDELCNYESKCAHAEGVRA